MKNNQINQARSLVMGANILLLDMLREEENPETIPEIVLLRLINERLAPHLAEELKATMGKDKPKC